MFDWLKYRAGIKNGVGHLVSAAPEAFAGFRALNASMEKATHLDAKTRELIALAVAVTTRCDGCIAGHVDAALKAGVTKEEIGEALGVAIALNAGAALVYSARAMDCFEELSAA